MLLDGLQQTVHHPLHSPTDDFQPAFSETPCAYDVLSHGQSRLPVADQAQNRPEHSLTLFPDILPPRGVPFLLGVPIRGSCQAERSRDD